MASLLPLLSLVFNLLILLSTTRGAKLLFEDGYTVSTVVDGDKVKVNPHAILYQSPPSDLFIILDSSSSTFYTLSFSKNTQESVIKKLVGNGQQGYVDGELSSAMFNKPKSFAVDYKGNVYVADQSNHAIRKITKSGVTTIAGGYSQKPGRADGPARNATFSADFELVFVPERCALMIADHGNRLIRQIDLKAEDCTRPSSSALGTSSVWLLAVGLSCVLGLMFGFFIRPYVLPHDGFEHHHWSRTRIHYLMSLERQLAMLYFAIRSAIVSSTAYLLLRRFIDLSLSYLSLVCRFRVAEPQASHEKPVSLMDCDESSSCQLTRPSTIENQLELISFDGTQLSENMDKNIMEEANLEVDCTSFGGLRRVDAMIQANIVSFAEQVPTVPSAESPKGSLGLVKRK